ncbi:MAG: beta-ketoacyl-[acyl-carrier-protein] synthase family protein [Planctomycetota bacterium]
MASGRVVITGVGWVTPLGWEIDSVWGRLLRGERSMGPLERYDGSTWSTGFASQVSGFDLRDRIGARAERHARASRSTGFALSACDDAWSMAGLGAARPDPARVGVYLGAGEGEVDYATYVRAHAEPYADGGFDPELFARAASRFDPANEVEQEPQLTSTHLAVEFDAQGPCLNCMTACAASTQAVGESVEIIRRGDADVMIAGGSHSMIHPLGMTGFMRLTAMSTRGDEPMRASRPFDVSRDGFVMGEGAGIVILEDLEHARSRGARILAELAGFGSTADAYRITDIHPDGKGGAGAMLGALRQAGIDPHGVDERGRPLVHWVNAHGTGTQENDKIESAAVRSVFGDLAGRVPFTSVKSMLGHLIQAAGAVELITCVKAIETGMIPPTVNLNEVDPLCALDHVPNEARDLNDEGGVSVCVSNSFGFGGQNDSVCVRRFED